MAYNFVNFQNFSICFFASYSWEFSLRKSMKISNSTTNSVRPLFTWAGSFGDGCSRFRVRLRCCLSNHSVDLSEIWTDPHRCVTYSNSKSRRSGELNSRSPLSKQREESQRCLWDCWKRRDRLTGHMSTLCACSQVNMVLKSVRSNVCIVSHTLITTGPPGVEERVAEERPGWNI